MTSFRHDTLIHRGDEELIRLALPFVSEGVARGDAVLVRLTAREHVALADALGGTRGITFMSVTGDVGPFSLLAHDHARIARALDDGAPAARVLAAAPTRSAGHCLRYEAALHHQLHTRPVWQVCAYDAAVTPDDMLLDAGRTHATLHSARGTEASTRVEDPRAILRRCAEEEADPLEQQPPTAQLIDPTRAELMELVERLGPRSGVAAERLDALRLSAVLVLDNAFSHGRPPVSVRVWEGPGRLVLILHDAGPGPADPFSGLVPARPTGRPNGLFLVHEAVSLVSLIYAPDGFSVRLVEYA